MKGSASEISFILETWNNNPKTASKKIKKENPVLFNNINKFIDINGSFSEKCKLFTEKRTTRPKCYCGKVLKYLDFNRGYSQFCSRKCNANSIDTNEKKKITTMNRFGESHFSKTDNYKEKFKKTMQERYGCDNPGQILENLQKRARKKQQTFYNNLNNLSYAKPNFSFDEYTHVRDKNLNWTCKKCNEEFLSNIFSKEPKCPRCYPPGIFGGTSSYEKEISDWLTSVGVDQIILNDRNVIFPKEIDILLPEHRLAIEINGVYWHSDRFLEKNYHKEKFQLVSEKNIELLMISDYDWDNKQDIIKNMILHKLKKTQKRIYARNCYVKETTPKQARDFLDKYHMNGFSAATRHYGIFTNHDHELVSVVSVSDKSRFEKNTAEIVRMAFSSHVPGALGKVIKHIKKNTDINKLTTYADLRFGSGNVYIANGFKFVSQTGPGYWYFYQGRMWHRLSWTKKKLVSMGHSQTKTEFEIMNELGALRIFDAGHNKFEMEI